MPDLYEFSEFVTLHLAILMFSSTIYNHVKVSAHNLSSVHATIATLFSIYVWYYDAYSELPKIVPFSVGYFIIDCILWPIIIGDTLGNNITTVIHHGGALFFLYHVCYNSIHMTQPLLSTYFLFTEVTTPFINFYQISKYCNFNKTYVNINKIFVFILFFIVRVVGFFYVLLLAFMQDMYNPYLYVISTFFFLNCYWFYKMCRMIAKISA